MSHQSRSRKRPRRLYGDEHYVTSAYQEHAEKCAQCTDRFRYRLCRKGLCLARDVNSYLRKDNGRVFAAYNHGHDRTPALELPRSFDAVNWLLSAVEDGLCLYSSLSNVSGISSSHLHDSVEIIERQPQSHGLARHTYQIPSRLVLEGSELSWSGYMGYRGFITDVSGDLKLRMQGIGTSSRDPGEDDRATLYATSSCIMRIYFIL